jgi:hypothetical protein
MLPILRLPWRRKTAVTAPEPVPAPSEPPAPPPEPAWRHIPPEPQEAATTCGQCGEKMPEKAVDREFCKPLCASAWQAARADSIAKFIGPTPVKASMPEFEEPPWLAQITAWERKKAQLLVESRKSPTEDAA